MSDQKPHYSRAYRPGDIVRVRCAAYGLTKGQYVELRACWPNVGLWDLVGTTLAVYEDNIELVTPVEARHRSRGSLRTHVVGEWIMPSAGSAGVAASPEPPKPPEEDSKSKADRIWEALHGVASP